MHKWTETFNYPHFRDHFPCTFAYFYPSNCRKIEENSLNSFIRCISFSYPNYNDIVRKRLQVIITADSNSVCDINLTMTAINKAGSFCFEFSRQKYLFLDDNCCCFSVIKPCFNAEFIIYYIIISS